MNLNTSSTSKKLKSLSTTITIFIRQFVPFLYFRKFFSPGILLTCDRVIGNIPDNLESDVNYDKEFISLAESREELMPFWAFPLVSMRIKKIDSLLKKIINTYNHIQKKRLSLIIESKISQQDKTTKDILSTSFNESIYKIYLHYCALTKTSYKLTLHKIYSKKKSLYPEYYKKKGLFIAFFILLNIHNTTKIFTFLKTALTFIQLILTTNVSILFISYLSICLYKFLLSPHIQQDYNILDLAKTMDKNAIIIMIQNLTSKALIFLTPFKSPYYQPYSFEKNLLEKSLIINLKLQELLNLKSTKYKRLVAANNKPILACLKNIAKRHIFQLKNIALGKEPLIPNFYHCSNEENLNKAFKDKKLKIPDTTKQPAKDDEDSIDYYAFQQNIWLSTDMAWRNTNPPLYAIAFGQRQLERVIETPNYLINLNNVKDIPKQNALWVGCNKDLTFSTTDLPQGIESTEIDEEEQLIPSTYQTNICYLVRSTNPSPNNAVSSSESLLKEHNLEIVPKNEAEIESEILNSIRGYSMFTSKYWKETTIKENSTVHKCISSELEDTRESVNLFFPKLTLKNLIAS